MALAVGRPTHSGLRVLVLYYSSLAAEHNFRIPVCSFVCRSNMSKKLKSLAADGLKPLSNRKLELVAQHLAKGATAKESSIAAGYRTTGAAFAVNCRQRANSPEVKSRVVSLQAKAAERLTVDLAWIYERLVEIASRAPYQEEIRTSDKLRALDMLIRLRGFYAPEKKVVAPADSKSVRLTQVFDAEQLKARMTVVELSQVINGQGRAAVLSPTDLSHR
jgi:phage terminase small subunit